MTQLKLIHCRDCKWRRHISSSAGHLDKNTYCSYYEVNHARAGRDADGKCTEYTKAKKARKTK